MIKLDGFFRMIHNSLTMLFWLYAIVFLFCRLVFSFLILVKDTQKIQVRSSKHNIDQIGWILLHDTQIYWSRYEFEKIVLIFFQNS